ncbi:hypothetical protein [Nostoc sp. ChiQUE01b]|uniref:hypothetical protein n=1 Tax=Nostoc sp. ChiQUE01b TaxID=3075376 RepID=UPI002AD2BA39|nr:hypothetical protein [Nostoc sp. ChiQUE01b]
MPKILPNMTEINAYYKDAKRRFKLACTVIDKTIPEVMVELLETWLEEQEQRNQKPDKK